MLVSMVVVIKPKKSGTLPPSTGRAMHAVFLNWVKLANPALSVSLHETATYKPFTVSALAAWNGEFIPTSSIFTTKSQDLILTPGQLYWFRITSLEASLSEFLVESLAGPAAPALPPVLNREFELVYVTTDAAKHPWAATETYPNLLSMVATAQLNRRASQTTKVKLLFTSATTFKSNGRSLALPLPVQTFFSLANRWNAFSNQPIEAAFGEWLEQNVSISSYELKSELIWLEGSPTGPKLVGFRGWCEYVSFSSDEEWNYLLDLLARFAFFSGIGYKTTWGFGQALALG